MNDIAEARTGDAAKAPSKRADAERNRERIIQAAQRLFSSDGLGVSLAAVAREAGVGKATLARHFASRDELTSAVFTNRMADYVAATTKALADPDPWHGFTVYVVEVCAMQATDRGFAVVLSTAFSGRAELEKSRIEALQGFLQLIDRAKATGHLRADFTSEDLVLLLMANAGVVEATLEAAPHSWPRFVGQMLRAYAGPEAPLPDLPPAPSSSDLYLAMSGRN